MEWSPIELGGASLTESPRYAHQQWVWVDIPSKILYRCKTPIHAARHPIEQTVLPDEVACVLPTAQADVWLLMGRHDVYTVDWTSSNATIQAHRMSLPYDPNTHRFNDGQWGPDGAVWISTLVDARQPNTAGLYRIQDQHAELKAADLVVGNGLAFSPDGTQLWLADTRQRCIWRYPFNKATGVLGQRTLVAQYTTANERPDGATIGPDGHYWVAILEGSRLDRYTMDGKPLPAVPVPLKRPTMPCFGGHGLPTLLVTGLAPTGEYPNAQGFEQATLVFAPLPPNLTPA
ncbi:SMP-30/gluconolactonase/LRE family protein [Limnobacter humi]|uniref:SMP-30/gluconolactonase/LRE family protein n=1 Tax=Limnobacter humi TaxID=1778671 RepID=A0ABT1WIN6_9BURK|nr:SMP-30/gluconolactonase/LRE family protein [Limnobacter humi]MCQ8896753.1 SMP-30/gluconolactonase/LRE family protein [Limnobacter humi]